MCGYADRNAGAFPKGVKDMEQPRAVIYNRCSTEEESQKDALVKQVQESRDCVCKQGWKLVDAYVEAKSGTTVKGRLEYNRLYQDLEKDKFDIIVIKSQDRLMRNTKDWYLFLDRMQKHQKKLYMYLEGKFYTPEDALITGIKAILAEEYSRELSKKINNAHKNRQKEGKSFVFTNHMYGLKKCPDKAVVIDEREAEMIRLIFRLSVNGYGTHSIAQILYEKGYTNRNGKMLSPSMLRNIIRNPIYKGTVIQNKRHYEFERKQTVKNPEGEWIVHKDAVPAIVDEQLFEAVNRALDGRRRDGRREGKYTCKDHGGRHALSGKIICGLCKEPYYRTIRRNKTGKAAEWKCSNYLHHGRRTDKMRKEQIRKIQRGKTAGCDNIHLDEKKMLLCLEQICGSKGHQPQQKEILEEMMPLLRQALENGGVKAERMALEADTQKAVYRKTLLLEKLLDGVIDDRDYLQKSRELQQKIDYNKERIGQLQDDLSEKAALEERLADIKERLKKDMIRQAQDAMMSTQIRRIVVYPEYMELFLHTADETTMVRIPQNCSTSPVPMREAQKEQIFALVESMPAITAKMIAQEMDVTLSLVRRRMRELKEEGKISYDRSEGTGKWRASAKEKSTGESVLDFSD